MGKLMGLDFGLKRTGIAITDDLQIIASPLITVDSGELMSFIKGLIPDEKVEGIVVGMPMDLNNQDTDLTGNVKLLIEALRSNFPNIAIYSYDERFTSKMAMQSMLEGGIKKKQRMQKGNLDKVSAAIILQSFLDSR